MRFVLVLVLGFAFWTGRPSLTVVSWGVVRLFIYHPLLAWCCGLSLCLCWVLLFGHCSIASTWFLGGAPAHLHTQSALMLGFVLVLVLDFAFWTVQPSLALVSCCGPGLFTFLFCIGGVACPVACVGPCPLGTATFPGHGVLEGRRSHYPRPPILH